MNESKAEQHFPNTSYASCQRCLPLAQRVGQRRGCIWRDPCGGDVRHYCRTTRLQWLQRISGLTMLTNDDAHPVAAASSGPDRLASWVLSWSLFCWKIASSCSCRNHSSPCVSTMHMDRPGRRSCAVHAGRQ